MKRLLFVALAALALSMVVQPVALHAQKAATVAGTVKSVSTDSLTITSGGKEMTFKVDGATKFVGKGLTTKSAKGKIMATDAVGEKDMVRVTYHDMGGTLHAASVRVEAKGITKK